jgi:uncharacterized protein YndB with AHSA1/START domain
MSASRRSPRSGTRGYALLIDIDVPIGRVWRALTEPGLLRIWSGQEAEIDARQGGLYRLGLPRAGGREAHIDIFEVNRRLRLIYINGPDAPTDDSAVVDDFLLDGRNREARTLLRVLGSGVPDAVEWDKAYARMRMRWERYLARLKVTLENPPASKSPPPPSPPGDPPLPGLDY